MLIFFLAFLWTADAEAQSKKPSTQMYEAEPESESESEKTTSFSAKVRLMRDEEEGMEVFFESDKQTGAYLLPKTIEKYGSLIKILEASQKPKGSPVNVVANKNKTIKAIKTPESEH